MDNELGENEKDEMTSTERGKNRGNRSGND